MQVLEQGDLCCLLPAVSAALAVDPLIDGVRGHPFFSSFFTVMRDTASFRIHFSWTV